jgi:deazaflavin-dependent oxidoreductase (nitroreductase family)
MWFMNHVFNPIVRWVLSSRLHALMSKNVLLIAFRGRKSGKEYSTPVQFAQEDKQVWILVGFAEKKNWWHNLMGGAPVRLCIEGKWQDGQAVLLKGEPDRDAILVGLKQIFKKSPAYQKQDADLGTESFKWEDVVMVKVVLD